MNPTDELIYAQLEYYVERVYHFTQVVPDIELSEFFREQAQTLLGVESGLVIVTLPYHRIISPSGGLLFETKHGDPELVFSGL